MVTTSETARTTSGSGEDRAKALGPRMAMRRRKAGSRSPAVRNRFLLARTDYASEFPAVWKTISRSRPKPYAGFAAFVKCFCDLGDVKQLV
jgi:hypothetical protein